LTNEENGSTGIMNSAFQDIARSKLSPRLYDSIKKICHFLQDVTDWVTDFARAPQVINAKLQALLASSSNMKPGVAASRRIFDYDVGLLPNKYIAELESESPHLERAKDITGLSLGYPAWNLLYYSVLCGLRNREREIIVVETGTNRASSAIILAQALLDANVKGRVYTIDIDPDAVELARKNIKRAGVEGFIELNIGDSIDYLKRKVREWPYIDFAFLDAGHSYRSVMGEFALIYPKIVTCKGMVYFDNTRYRPIQRALKSIQRLYGGNIIQFDNCSWGLPGNAIWQAAPF
jgi:predicted O-methyltransferase YrrM